MESRSGRSVSEQPGGGPDRISVLPDDLLLLILARLGCAAAAARTGVLSRRWRGIWPRLRKIVFRDVALRSLEAALGGVSRPPPPVSLLVIRFKSLLCKRFVNPGRLNSLLCAAARLEPEKFIFELPSELIHGYPGVDLPCFNRATSIVLDLSSTVFLRVAAGVEFPALEMLTVRGCTVDIDVLLSCCPRLRRLRLSKVLFGKNGLQFNSLSLQEIAVDTCRISNINIVAPLLKQLTMSFSTWARMVAVRISVLAPMVEKVSWHCFWAHSSHMFGVWRLDSLRLKTAERQGQFPSLHISASADRIHGEAGTFAQEIEKHMIAKFSVVEIRLKANEHGFGALVFYLLGINPIRCATQRLNVVLKRSAVKRQCTPECPCQPTDWRSQTISLTALEEVEINGFGGDDHALDFLKLILKCAPMIKKMTVKLSGKASSIYHGCTTLYNIFKAYSSIELNVYLISGEHVPRA